MYISDCTQTTFFYLGRFQKKIPDDQCSSITKGSIYQIKHMAIQPFTMGVDSPEIGCLMEVSILFHIINAHTADFGDILKLILYDVLGHFKVQNQSWKIVNYIIEMG